MFVHAGRYYPPKAWGVGFGKGLLSVALRGGLATGACFIGSGCEQVSDRALLRMSIAILAGGAIDVAFLAYEAAEIDALEVTHRFEPVMSHDGFGARCSAASEFRESGAG
jgi:hypothetical protein